MADMEEQDRRHFLLSTTAEEPIKTYAEIREKVSEALTPKPDMDSIENIGWLRKQ